MSKAVKRKRSVSKETTDSDLQLISNSQSAPKMNPGYKTLLAKSPGGTQFLTSFELALAKAAERSQAESLFKVTPAEAIEEFRRLIALKVYMKDTDGILLSPSPIMDAIWHEVILDTKTYASMQTTLGCTLHHRPEVASVAEKDAVRSDWQRWKQYMPLAERDKDPYRSSSPEEAILEQPPAKKVKYDQSEIQAARKIRLVVVDYFGQRRAHEILAESCVVTEIWKLGNLGVTLDDFRAVCNGQQLQEGHYAEDHRITNGSVVHLVQKLR
ncbi:hypothetical protein HYALB_00010560 [Hymenoscyphus albidus]|uniref:Ubiquitin-like domain-containing protein n=1 Tax=Hymenoscyphus albidus TaxID=595503 RepID=A0A9N9Q5D1_9HELO|nr:hypothetical protein HYALB_00010560 [Hymenoscyphus albidus]